MWPERVPHWSEPMYRGQAAGCQGRRKGLLGITPHLATGSRHLALLLEGRAGWSLEAALAAPPPSVAGWAAERHWVLGSPWSRAPPFSGWVGVWCGAGSAGLGFLPGRRDLGGWRRRQAPPARGMATLGVVMFPGEVPRPGPPWDLGWADGRGRPFGVRTGPAIYWDPIGMGKVWVPGSGAPPLPRRLRSVPLALWGSAQDLVEEVGEERQGAWARWAVRGCWGAAGLPPWVLYPWCCVRAGGGGAGQRPLPLTLCRLRHTWHCAGGSDRAKHGALASVVCSGSWPQGMGTGHRGDQAPALGS